MRRDTANVAFLDILFIMLLMIIPLINQPIHDEGKNFPLSITVTWDTGVDVDIDSYLLTPDGEVLWFSKKDLGGVHIDRDDLGSYANLLNREILILDEAQDGIYFFSLHGYHYKDKVKDLKCDVIMEDSEGNRLWEVFLPCPEEGAEIPIMKFEILNGKVVHFEPSHIPIVKMRKRS